MWMIVSGWGGTHDWLDGGHPALCHRFKKDISSERKSAALGYSLGMYVVGGCCRWWAGSTHTTMSDEFAGRR